VTLSFSAAFAAAPRVEIRVGRREMMANGAAIQIKFESLFLFPGEKHKFEFLSPVLRASRPLHEFLVWEAGGERGPRSDHSIRPIGFIVMRAESLVKILRLGISGCLAGLCVCVFIYIYVCITPWENAHVQI
jgi:hypothetical protein